MSVALPGTRSEDVELGPPVGPVWWCLRGLLSSHAQGHAHPQTERMALLRVSTVLDREGIGHSDDPHCACIPRARELKEMCVTLRAQVQKLPSLQVGPLCQLLCLRASPIRHHPIRNVRAVYTVNRLKERLFHQAKVRTPCAPPPFFWGCSHSIP